METRKTAKWEQLSPPIELHFAAFVCETIFHIWIKIFSFLSQTVSGYIYFFLIIGKKSIQRQELLFNSFCSLKPKIIFNQVYEIQPQNAELSSV